MTIGRKQILQSIDRANRSNSSYGCDHCWLSHLGKILNLEDVQHPCSYIKQLLNGQYHTSYKIMPGLCNVNTFPTKEILAKLNNRIAKI